MNQFHITKNIVFKTKREKKTENSVKNKIIVIIKLFLLCMVKNHEINYFLSNVTLKFLKKFNCIQIFLFSFEKY